MTERAENTELIILLRPPVDHNYIFLSAGTLKTFKVSNEETTGCESMQSQSEEILIILSRVMKKLNSL
jgi:hypothetical protein